LEAASGAVGLKQQQTKDHEEYNTVVAGEPISVRVTMRNPLGVKLRLSAVRLTCEFTPVGGQVRKGWVGTPAHDPGLAQYISSTWYCKQLGSRENYQ
jgi:hypothetical protein